MPAPGASSEQGALEWLTRRKAIEAAEASYRSASEPQRELHRRARLALEVGERAGDPIDPLHTGQGTAFAIEAYRQSIHWTLRLVEDAADEPVGADADHLAARFGLALSRVKDALPARSQDRVTEVLGRTFVEDAAEPEAALAADATLLRETALALLRHTEGPEGLLARYRRERRRRGMAALLAAGALLVVLVSAGKAATRKTDLAKNKAWRASSSWGDCTPDKHSCGPISPTEIFFHTNEDASPWVEIDLGRPTDFSSLTIKNRSDCCRDRAVPLIVEVANEPDQWREVAKRNQVFETWEPKLGAQNARWVRLRVARKSWLHLEQFSVHR